MAVFFPNESISYFTSLKWPLETYYLCLSNSSGLSRTNTTANFFAAEISGSGYTRKPVTFSSAGTYDNSNQRHNMPPLVATVTASGGSIVYRVLFLVKGGASTGTSGNVVYVDDLGASQTIVDGQSAILTLNIAESGVTYGTIF